MASSLASQLPPHFMVSLSFFKGKLSYCLITIVSLGCTQRERVRGIWMWGAELHMDHWSLGSGYK